MPKAVDIARFFLLLACEEPEPAPLTHMHLQKLLYYAQGWTLGTKGVPLFNDRIEAWVHGPVVKAVYPTFADYKNGVIAPHEASDAASLSNETRDIVRSVWRYYRQFSASKLREMTHAESPWLEARRGLEPDQPGDREIAAESMTRFFRERYQRTAEPGLDLASIEAGEADFAAGRVVPLKHLIDRYRDELRNRAG